MLIADLGANPDAFDAFVLDIIMDGPDGIQVGRKIRELGIRKPIIYTTSAREYAFEAYGIDAIAYLPKPLDPDRLDDALDLAWELNKPRTLETVQIKGKDGMSVIAVSDIVYVENVARAASYHLRDGSVLATTTNRTSFENSIGSLLQHAAFVQPHKSFFVNMHYIRTLGAEAITLDDGQTIPISRRNLMDTKRRYLRFLADEGGESC